MLFLHGGVYCYEIDPFHWRLIADLHRRTGLRFVVPIMTLAPLATADVTVPAVADLAEELGARALLGDSSGGGLALAAAMLLRDRGLRPALVLSAPWLDSSGTAARLAELDASDPWLAVPGTQAAGALYRGDLPPDDPRVSPLFGALDGLGPVTLFCGTRDILLADAERFIPLAEAAGLPLDAHIGEGMIHNYPLLPTPEGKRAREVIAGALLQA